MIPVPCSRLLALVCALSLAACGGEGPAGPDPTEPTPPPACPTTAAQVSGAGNLPVLGLGCVAERYTSELWVHGDWAYTGTTGNPRRYGNLGNAIKVWNVAGPAPVLVDSVIVRDAVILGDVQTSDDGRLLVVATEGGMGSVVVYDLADPAKPREMVRHGGPTTRTGVHTAEVARVNGKPYAFLSVNPSPSRLVVLDLSNPTDPREVWTRDMGSPYVHDVFVRDGLLFTALWNAGTVVWDIGGGGRGGSPESPVQLYGFPTVGGKVHNLWWYHDPSGPKRYVFVGEEGPATFGVSASGDVHVVDVTDPANAREVAFYTLPGAGAHNFSVDERSGVLYAAYYNGGVRALDVRGDLSACAAAHRDSAGRCDLGRMGREVGRGLVGGAVWVWGVQLAGSHLYASDKLNGLWKLDVSSLKREPARP